MPRVVLDMADRRPIWAMPAWVPERLSRELPGDWDVWVATEHTDGSGDGATRAGPEVLAAVRDAQVYVGWGVPESVLEAGAHLEWVHSASAGIGSSLTPTMLDRSVVFTNSAGIHAPPMAETVLGMILHFGRGLDLALDAQRRGEWAQEAFYPAESPLFELSEATVGIVGYGGIGREVARRVAALGAHVVALKRSPRSKDSAALAPVGGSGSLAGRVEIVSGEGGLNRLLETADVLVVTAPETAETRGMLDAEALARLRRGALLVNVARGTLIDEAALVEALREGRLRGAGLDVFAEEPLPEGHPLWELPNVLVTPHVSAVTTGFWRRECDLMVRNLGRHLSRAPLTTWENVVDKRAGY